MDPSLRTIVEATGVCTDVVNEGESLAKSVLSSAIEKNRKRKQSSQKHLPSVPASCSSFKSDAAPHITESLSSGSEVLQCSEVADRIFRVHCEKPVCSDVLSQAAIDDQKLHYKPDSRLRAGCVMTASDSDRAGEPILADPQIGCDLFESEERVVIARDEGIGTRHHYPLQLMGHNGKSKMPISLPYTGETKSCRALTRSCTTMSTCPSSSSPSTLRNDVSDEVDRKRPIKIADRKRVVVGPAKSSEISLTCEVEVAIKRRRGRPKSKPG